MNYFKHNLGVDFGCRKKEHSEMSSITIDGRTVYIDTSNSDIKGLALSLHSYRDFGLLPHSKPVISAPEVQSDGIIDVPGMDGGIDPTEALDGVVHYRMREFEAEYVHIGNRAEWDAVYHDVLAAIHGQRLQIILDEDPTGYYEGRFAVEEPEYDDKKEEMFLTVTGTLQPYKWLFSDSAEDWLWDPFSFIDGVIEEYSEITIVSGTPKTVTLYAGHNSEVPDIYLNSEDDSVSVSYKDITGVTKIVSLQHGSNVENTPDLLLRRKPVELTFTGAGTLSISHRRGLL